MAGLVTFIVFVGACYVVYELVTEQEPPDPAVESEPLYVPEPAVPVKPKRHK